MQNQKPLAVGFFFCWFFTNKKNNHFGRTSIVILTRNRIFKLEKYFCPKS